MYLAVFMGPGPGIVPADEHAIIDFCIEQSIACADAGFSLITFGEQHFNGYEPYCNPFMMGARVAPYMKNSYLGTTVCPLPLNHPLRLAENINVLDVLTRGKLIVGISAGRPSSGPNMPSDFDSFGLKAEDREALFDSKLDIMLRAWAQRREHPAMEFETAWDKGTLRGQLMPHCYRDGRPLLAIGANSDASILRAAQLRWPLFLGPCLLSEAVSKFKLYRTKLETSGMSLADIEHLVSMSLVARNVVVADTDAEAWELAEQMMGQMINRRNGESRSLYELSKAPLSSADMTGNPFANPARLVQSGLICGSPESVIEQIKLYPEQGIPQLHVRFPVSSPFRPETVWRSFNLFVSEVMPKLKPQTFAAPLR